MAEVRLSRHAVEDLDALIASHGLPADTRTRFARSLRALEQFPLIGRELDPGGFPPEHPEGSEGRAIPPQGLRGAMPSPQDAPDVGGNRIAVRPNARIMRIAGSITEAEDPSNDHP